MMHDQTTPQATRATAAFLLLLSLLPLIGAQFGYGNQIEQFLIAERLRDPAFAAGDQFLSGAATFGPRIYYAWTLAALQSVLPLALIVHLGMVLFSLLLGWVTLMTARRVLGADWVGAGLAAIMAVTNGSFSLGLAGFLRFDSFQPANPAVALALLGVLALLRGRVWLALPAFVAAGLFHPLIGAEVAVIGYAAVFLSAFVARPKTGDAGPAALPVFLSGLAFGAAMVAAWALPTLGAAGDGGPSHVFDILVAFRAPHHYLGLGFPRRSWLVAGLFVAAALVAFVLFLRDRGPSRGVIALMLMSAATLGLSAASLYFVDISHSNLWSTAQLFRMLMITKWVGFLFLGWQFGRAAQRDGLPAVLIAGMAVLATADAHGYAVAIAVAGLLALGLARGRRPVALAIAAVACLGIAFYMRRYGLGEQGVRAGLALALLWLLSTAAPLGQLAAVAATAIALVATYVSRDEGLFGWPALRAQYSWSDLTGPAEDISRAAARVSPDGAIWDVPPTFENFRLLARRAIVADFTSIPFDSAGMTDWRARVEAIYGPISGSGFAAQKSMIDNYRAMPHLDVAARDYGATFAVLYKDTPWTGPVLAQNDEFKAVAIGPGTN